MRLTMFRINGGNFTRCLKYGKIWKNFFFEPVDNPVDKSVDNF